MKTFTLILCVVCLTGCGAKSRFSCPYEGGVTCMSMSEVDKEIKRGASAKQTKNKRSIAKLSEEAVNPFQAGALGNAPVRTQEQILQLWVAPFEDSQGVYQQQTYLNVVVTSPRWLPPIVDDASQREAF